MSANGGATILILDDDEELNVLLTQYLGRFGYDVVTATHPDEGLRALKTTRPELMILDVMLPSMDGFAVCRKVREICRIPIIMLTARGDVMDRILGLELGADDYLPKPFEPRELVARIQAVLRRGAPQPSADAVRIGTLELVPSAQSACLRGQPLVLTTAEFALLELLVRSRGRVLTREYILDQTRGIDWESFDRSVDVLISRVRHKLEDDPKLPRCIKTVWGNGYCFIGGDSE